MFSSSILANQSLVSFSILKSMLYSKNVYFKYFGKSESGESSELRNSKKHAIIKKCLAQVFGKSQSGEFGRIHNSEKHAK